MSERSEWSERVRGARKSTIVELRLRGKFFRAKGPKIVASYVPEPCRSFVFGPKPYAQHLFDFESGGRRIRESAVDKRPPQCQAPSSDVGEANAQLHNFCCPSLLPLLISNCCLLQCSAMFVRLTAGVCVFFRSKRRILTEILQCRAPLCPFLSFGR